MRPGRITAPFGSVEASLLNVARRARNRSGTRHPRVSSYLSVEMNFSTSASGCCVTAAAPQGRSRAAISVITMAKDSYRIHVAFVRFDSTIAAW